jgi:hypothetical protein
LFWLSGYVASHCLAVVQQSGAKQFLYCFQQNLYSNCEAQRASKNLKKLYKIELEIKNNA